MPTSVPAPLMDGVPVAPTSAPYHNDVEYEDGVDSGKNDSITQPYNCPPTRRTPCHDELRVPF